MGKWEMVRLGDILIAQPKSKIKAGQGTENGKYKFYTSSNKQYKYIDENIYNKPALIFGTGGNASVHYCDETFSTSTDCLVFYANEKQDLKTIYLYLSGNMQVIEAGFKGAGLKHISKDYILNIKIPLPPIAEQKIISKSLDLASEIVKCYKVQLAELDKLVQSVFYEMFGDPIANEKGWELKKVHEIFKIGSSKRIYQREQTVSGVPFLRISNLVKQIANGLCTTDLYISEEKYSSLKKKYLVPEPGDILVTSRGTIGLCYIIKENDKFYFQDGMISWLHKKHPKVESVYISTLFETPQFHNNYSKIQSGTTIPYLSITQLSEFNIMFPPYPLQTRFTSIVTVIDAQKAQFKQALTEAENLFNSLMQEYFE